MLVNCSVRASHTAGLTVKETLCSSEHNTRINTYTHTVGILTKLGRSPGNAFEQLHAMQHADGALTRCISADQPTAKQPGDSTATHSSAQHSIWLHAPSGVPYMCPCTLMLLTRDYACSAAVSKMAWLYVQEARRFALCWAEECACQQQSHKYTKQCRQKRAAATRQEAAACCKQALHDGVDACAKTINCKTSHAPDNLRVVTACHMSHEMPVVRGMPVGGSASVAQHCQCSMPSASECNACGLPAARQAAIAPPVHLQQIL